MSSENEVIFILSLLYRFSLPLKLVIAGTFSFEDTLPVFFPLKAYFLPCFYVQFEASFIPFIVADC